MSGTVVVVSPLEAGSLSSSAMASSGLTTAPSSVVLTDATRHLDSSSLGGVVSNLALSASPPLSNSSDPSSTGSATTVIPHSPTAASGATALSLTSSPAAAAPSGNSIVVNGNIHNELNPLMQLLSSPLPSTQTNTTSSSSSSASSSAASVAPLTEREEQLRRSIKELESKGFGISDALARVNREAKLRMTLDERRKEGELRITALTVELRDLETARMSSDKLASENAEVAHAWKERCEAFESAYNRVSFQAAAAAAAAAATAASAGKGGALDDSPGSLGGSSSASSGGFRSSSPLSHGLDKVPTRSSSPLVPLAFSPGSHGGMIGIVGSPTGANGLPLLNPSPSAGSSPPTAFGGANSAAGSSGGSVSPTTLLQNQLLSISRPSTPSSPASSHSAPGSPPVAFQELADAKNQIATLLANMQQAEVSFQAEKARLTQTIADALKKEHEKEVSAICEVAKKSSLKLMDALSRALQQGEAAALSVSVIEDAIADCAGQIHNLLIADVRSSNSSTSSSSSNASASSSAHSSVLEDEASFELLKQLQAKLSTRSVSLTSRHPDSPPSLSTKTSAAPSASSASTILDAMKSVFSSSFSSSNQTATSTALTSNSAMSTPSKSSSGKSAEVDDPRPPSSSSTSASSTRSDSEEVGKGGFVSIGDFSEKMQRLEACVDAVISQQVNAPAPASSLLDADPKDAAALLLDLQPAGLRAQLCTSALSQIAAFTSKRLQSHRDQLKTAVSGLSLFREAAAKSSVNADALLDMGQSAHSSNDFSSLLVGGKIDIPALLESHELAIERARKTAAEETRLLSETSIETRSKLVREWEEYANHWETRGRDAERLNAEWESAFDTLQVQTSSLMHQVESDRETIESLRASLSAAQADLAHKASSSAASRPIPPGPPALASSGILSSLAGAAGSFNS